MSSLRKPVLWVVALLFVGACAPAVDQTPAPAAAAALEISEHIVVGDAVVAKLSNGLTVIVKATRSAPVVCVRAYVRAGGLYEREWLGCGISHLTEHLVAEGAVHESQGGAEAAHEKPARGRVSEIGGQSNAFTSLAQTGYYISAAAGKTTDCIELVADWMARPEISREDFEREHGVVQRELEMGKDSPGRQLHYAHMANLFAMHPAAVPVIGYPDPLGKLTYRDVLAYHKRMYVPANMVFCVVGDVDVRAVLDSVTRAFDGFATGRAVDLILPDVQPISSTRRVVKSQPALKEDLQTMSFLTIPLLHEDLYALDVLSYVLTSGRSSRLVQKIKRRKLVTAISSSSWTPQWGRGPFSVDFRCRVGSADAAEKAILDELRTIVREGVTPDELDRAKRQKVADYVYAQQSVESVSATLATDYLSTGDVAFSRDYTDRIQAVTAGQVRAAAKKYFTFDRMVITRLVPQAVQAVADMAGPRTESAATFFTLPNGLRAILYPTDSVQLVSMTFAATGGLLAETAETNGLGRLMTSLSTKGAGDLTAEQIAEFFDRAGGSIAGNCGNNTFYWRATVLDDSFPRAMEIFSDAIRRPTYSAKELDIIRPVLLATIDRIDQNWSSQLQKFFRGEFFTDSPYGMLAAGTKPVVESATTDQIAEWHGRFVKAGSSVLAVYGNFDASAARKQIETLFADLPKGRAALTIPPARVVEPGRQVETLKTTNKVAGVIVACSGMKIGNMADRLPLDVLDTIISGWRLPAGWLHEELRGKRLVYVVHAYNWTGLAPGAFVTYAACQPEKAPEVVGIIQRNLARAADFTPTQEQIDRAVNTILTAELLENQSMASLSMQAALDELYGFGYDFRSKLEAHYRKVTPSDVRRVAGKYLGKGFVVTVTTPDVLPFAARAEAPAGP